MGAVIIDGASAVQYVFTGPALPPLPPCPFLPLTSQGSLGEISFLNWPGFFHTHV